MSHTFPVKDYLTPEEHERMCNLAYGDKDYETLFDPGRHGLVGDTSGAYAHHQLKSAEGTACAEILRDVFSNASPRTEYERAKVAVSPEGLRKVVEHFQAVTKYKSGLPVPLAGLVQGMARRLDVTPDMVEGLAPGMFLSPDQIQNFSFEPGSFITPSNKKAHVERATKMLDDMVMAAFGVNARPPQPDAGRVYNPRDLGLGKEVLESAVRFASDIDNPTYDSGRALMFLQNARRTYPKQFSAVAPFLRDHSLALARQGKAIVTRASELTHLILE
jgi:hypothetical protein